MIPGDCVCGHDRTVHFSYGCSLGECTCVRFEEAQIKDPALAWIAAMGDEIAEKLCVALDIPSGTIWFDKSRLL